MKKFSSNLASLADDFYSRCKLLIQAARFDAEYHDVCESWLSGALKKGEIVALPSLVEIALLRITSNKTMPGGASPIQDPFRFLLSLRLAGCRRLEPSAKCFELFESMCIDHAIAGNDVNDVFLAALAKSNNATLVSMDKGVSRFAIRWFDPSA
jgi:uncharacterized protein